MKYTFRRINAQVTTICQNIFSIFEGSLRAPPQKWPLALHSGNVIANEVYPSEIIANWKKKKTTKLNFTLIVLWLFFTFITNVRVYIYICIHVCIYSLSHCFQLGNSGMFGSFCTLFLSLTIMFGRCISIFTAVD